eukprot:gene7535-713_t
MGDRPCERLDEPVRATRGRTARVLRTARERTVRARCELRASERSVT